MTTLRTAALALGFTLFGASAAFTASAVAGGHSRGGSQGLMKLTHAIATLDLTDEQVQMIEGLKVDTRADMKALHEEQGDESKAALKAIVAGEALDRDALHAQLDAAAAARTAVAHKALDRVVDLYDTLDDAQRAELAELVKEGMARREQVRHNFGEESGGRGGRRR